MSKQSEQVETSTSVRKAVTVEAPIARAFEVFTAGFDRWWPRSHHISEIEMAEAVMERRPGGRWYERGVDGSECEWGSVLVYEPPERLVLAWQINSDFKYDKDLVTEVEVRFTTDGPDRTRVELEHRNLDRFGPEAERVRAMFNSDGGWNGLLQLFATAVA
jgi:uncharacterized protein YndB with AHSA1/START domain